MEIKEFANKVCKSIEKELGDGYTTELKEVTKNNGVVLLGLMIGQTRQNVIPTIYLNHFWEAYEKGTTLSAIVDRIRNIYREDMPKKDVDISFFSDYNKIKNRICYKLIGREQNENLLKEVPYIPFFDLAICFYYAYEDDVLGQGSIMIKNVHMDVWKIGVPELYERAMVNTPMLFPAECQSMNTLLGNVDETFHQDEFDLIWEEVPMRVLSNTKNQYGAGCILYSGLLQQIAEYYGSFYILPSSIHEVILLKDNGEGDIENMKSMVRQINTEYVDREDVLSDNVYYFDLNKSIIQATN